MSSLMQVDVAYDVIGDIHGQGAKLSALLSSMGYVPTGTTFRPPQGRKAVFLGDLIDRGPDQRQVLEIVRGMVDAGNALCLMGNHEFNAIAYLLDDPRDPGECYRPNRRDSAVAAKNRHQHAAFLQQIGEGTPEHVEWVTWFRSLPLWMDLGGIRAVHGSWDAVSIELLAGIGATPGRILDDALVAAVHGKDDAGGEDPITKARKRLTCGVEIPLPPGRAVRKDEFQFDHVRIADWRHWASTLPEIALLPNGQEHLVQGWDVDPQSLTQQVSGTPLFLGHHWLSGEPKLESHNVACLDWSVGKGGPLVAYRWDGESHLHNAKLCWLRGF